MIRFVTLYLHSLERDARAHAGLILKPKMVEAPSRLLDAMKLHERMKISELATRFKTTEADVELAVIKLKSSGEPIEFNRETREVIYTPSKEE